jgi:quinol monooxygenase YgiN
MNVLFVKFSLKGMDDETFYGFTVEAAPAIAEVPGLISKAWLVDPDTGQYGGSYLFEDREAIEAYMQSPIIQDWIAAGNYDNLSVEIFDTLEPATSVTSMAILRGFALAS